MRRECGGYWPQQRGTQRETVVVVKEEDNAIERESSEIIYKSVINYKGAR